jgi:fumarate reductase subunit D
MEVWARILSGIASAALLGASITAYARRDGDGEHAREFQVLCLSGTLLAAVALFLSILLSIGNAVDGDGISAALLSTVGQRAALVALIAVLFPLFSAAHNLRRAETPLIGWAGFIPVATIAALGTLLWEDPRPSAWALLTGTLVAVGFGIAAVGQRLDVLTGKREDNHWAARLTFGGVAFNIALLAGIGWRIWGTPAGTTASAPGFYTGFLMLVALALISAARLAVTPRHRWLASLLDLSVGAVALWIAVSVQWQLPFSQ